MPLKASTSKQERAYKALVTERRGTRFIFDCGYHERYDPLLLEKRPDQRRFFEAFFDQWIGSRFDSILDVGCGTAFYFPVLQMYGRRIYGVDISDSMLSEARDHVPLAWGSQAFVQRAKATALPFHEGSFDCVLAMDTLHHIDDLDGALSEIARVLVPGGLFVALEPNIVNPVILLAHLIPEHERNALRYFGARAYRKRCCRFFRSVNIQHVNHVTSSAPNAIRGLLRVLDSVTLHPLFSSLSLRLIISARTAG